MHPEDVRGTLENDQPTSIDSKYWISVRSDVISLVVGLEPTSVKMCTQATVVLTPGDLQRRLVQPDYWGSEAWIADYARRTAVEGSFGNRKNTQTENLGRGHFKTGGVALANLFSLGAVASYNLRMLQGWHERTGLGDADHPLLLPEDDVFGAVIMTRDQYEKFSAWRVA